MSRRRAAPTSWRPAVSERRVGPGGWWLLGITPILVAIAIPVAALAMHLWGGHHG